MPLIRANFFVYPKKVGVYGFIALHYVLGVWFSVVYIGEHYVIDVVIGGSSMQAQPI